MLMHYSLLLFESINDFYVIKTKTRYKAEPYEECDYRPSQSTKYGDDWIALFSGLRALNYILYQLILHFNEIRFGDG